MLKRGLLVLFLVVLAMGFGAYIGWGARFAKAPPIEATPILGHRTTDYGGSTWRTNNFTDDWTARLDSIGPEGDAEAGRGVLGTPGKNIWLTSDGDTVLVIYGQPSGVSNNIFLLWIAYSYDGGIAWDNGLSTIGPGAARRIYPGVITPRDTLVPYVAYQHGTHDGANYLASDVYFSYDEFFPFMLYTPRRVGADDSTRHAWLPNLATSPAGDTVLLCWQNSVTGTVTGNAYLKRSFDSGLSWTEPEILMVNTQGNPSYDAVDTPRMAMGEGGYIFALFNWEPTGTDRWTPFYTESTDYGATWSTPQMVWPSWPPYPDCKCWWYGYDVVLDPGDGYRPHCAIKLGTADLEFGDVWECHPTSGSPGSWSNWVCQVLIGDGAGSTYATQPSITMDANGNLGITFAAFFIHSPTDTFGDIGICRSFDRGANWSSPEPLTYSPIVETCIEIASQTPHIDSIHGVYNRERDNCQSTWHFLATVVGVEETPTADGTTATGMSQNSPNPFSSTTAVAYQIGARARVSLVIYDVTGRVVKNLVDTEKQPGRYTAVWDGNTESGSPAPAGVYFSKLTAGTYVGSGKMVLVR